ncbi:hypothetical protein JCM8547_002157 [Rhodosporidiobolus lusitaniae]
MTDTAYESFLSSLSRRSSLSLTELRDLNLVAISPSRFGASHDKLESRRLWRDELSRHGVGTVREDVQRALGEEKPIEVVRSERRTREQGAIASTTTSMRSGWAGLSLSAGNWIGPTLSRSSSSRSVNPSCAADSDLQVAKKLAKQLNGTKCKGCKSVVTRKGGCPEVVCRCGEKLRVLQDSG